MEQHDITVKQVEPKQPPAKKKAFPANLFNWARKWSKVIFIVVLMLALLGLAYAYINTRNELKRLSDPKASAAVETQEVTAKVKQLIEVPAGEEPTLATVNDVSKLKKQEFFEFAQNGDKVLLFSKSGRAVLYRPSTNKVIEYSKVELNTTQ